MHRQNANTLSITLPTPSQPWQTTPTKRDIPIKKENKSEGRYSFIGDVKEEER